jgi:hypothetical protein
MAADIRVMLATISSMLPPPLLCGLITYVLMYI